jgi:hypothetical protein
VDGWADIKVVKFNTPVTHGIIREFFSGKFDTIHRADLRISDIGNLLGSDWVKVAHELGLQDSDINIIKSEYPDNNGKTPKNSGATSGKLKPIWLVLLSLVTKILHRAGTQSLC